MKGKFLIVLILLILIGCDHYGEVGDDFFYIQTDGTTMPVWVTGQMNSGKIILFVAGGPGDSGIMEPYIKANDQLQKKFGMVFYDQRGAGSTRGTSIKDQINIEQYVKDLDIIVDTINIKYDYPQIYIMSMSWGGFLTGEYLIDSSRASKIKAWIGIGGGHNWKRLEELSREFVINYAREHSTDIKWKKALVWYEKNQVIDKSNIIRHALYMQACDAYGRNSDIVEYHSGTLGLFFTSSWNSLTCMMKTMNLTLNIDHLDKNQVPRMGSIKLPSLLVWGEKDHRVPVILGKEVYNAIGSIDKELIILKNSGHGVGPDDVSIFNNKVVEFIDRN